MEKLLCMKIEILPYDSSYYHSSKVSIKLQRIPIKINVFIKYLIASSYELNNIMYLLFKFKYHFTNLYYIVFSIILI